MKRQRMITATLLPGTVRLFLPKIRPATHRLFASGLCLALLLLGQVPALATTHTVTNLNDSGPGSLRDRIAIAADDDTIVFGVGGAVQITSASLTITKSITIDGARTSNRVTIESANINLNTLVEITSPGVELLNLVIARYADHRGFGVSVALGADAEFQNCLIRGFRRGLSNAGVSDLADCEIVGNRIENPSDCQPILGVGIANTGLLFMRRSSLYSNEAHHSLNCDSAEADGLYNTGEAHLSNCTFLGDSLYNTSSDGTATLNLRGCTITSALISNDSGAIDLGNTLLYGVTIENSPTSTFGSSGYNLSDGSGDGFLLGPGDQTFADPKLGPFNSHGGKTLTFSLLKGSAAIDKGNSFGLTTDQRGQSRPVNFINYPEPPGGDASDIGAYEATDSAQTGNALIVTTLADSNDGLCGTIDCSLREAINAANAQAGADTVSFDAPLSGMISLSSALPAITTSVDLQGPGARLLAISGSAQWRVLSFSGGPSFLSGLTIRDGAVFGGPLSPALGGGLSNTGVLSVRDCAFTGNFAFGSDEFFPGGSGGPALGGAIYNTGGGNLAVEGCTFNANAVDGGLGAANSGGFNYGGAGGPAYGGAIFNDTNSTLAAINCTLANNNATGGAGGSNTGTNGFGGNGGAGGGAGVFSRGTSMLTSCTLRGNAGSGGAGGTGSIPARNGAPGASSGGMENENGSATVRNVIAALNTAPGGPDVKGPFTSEGYNFIGIGDFASGFNGAEDQVGTTAAPINPNLGPLQNNGGPTNTMALLPGSPALDKGKAFGATTDQRGLARPSDSPFINNAPGGDGSDIGAFEFGRILVVTTVADGNDGLCSPTHCTLREAINTANAQAGDEFITFKPGVAGNIYLNGPLETLSANMTLAGPGADIVTVRRYNGGNYRIFTISNGTGPGPAVEISGLTLADGRAISGSSPSNQGGGILNETGALTLRKCALVYNQATAEGGGLVNKLNAGPLIIEDCTFSGNSAGSSGGGIYQSGPSATVTNSTFSGNTAGTYGGGLANTAGFSATATMTLRNCTFALNTSGTSGLGGGDAVFSGFGSALSFANNIFQHNTGTSLSVLGTSPVSQGNNLSSDAANGDGGTGPGGYLNGPNDRRNTNPMLGPLANNGGPTQTQALLTGSFAINSGNNGLAPPLDQRGFLRSGISDRGAFEFNGTPPLPVSLVSVISRKIHGGTPFNVNLPLTGSPGIECRSGGAGGDHMLIFTFANTLTSVGSASVTSGTGSVSSSAIDADARKYLVNLTSVGNAQEITVTLTNVSDSAGHHSASVPVSIGVLLGDTNANRSVNSSDIGQTKSQSGAAVTAANFRTDVNVNGSINASDVSLVKSRSGTALP